MWSWGVCGLRAVSRGLGNCPSQRPRRSGDLTARSIRAGFCSPACLLSKLEGDPTSLGVRLNDALVPGEQRPDLRRTGSMLDSVGSVKSGLPASVQLPAHRT